MYCKTLCYALSGFERKRMACSEGLVALVSRHCGICLNTEHANFNMKTMLYKGKQRYFITQNELNCCRLHNRYDIQFLLFSLFHYVHMLLVSYCFLYICDFQNISHSIILQHMYIQSCLRLNKTRKKRRNFNLFTTNERENWKWHM